MDVQGLRDGTPGCANVLHLNHAGASLPPKQVTEAVKAHLDLEAAIGPVEAFEARTTELADAKAMTGQLLNADPSEIAFTGSANESWQLAFDSLNLADGQRVLVHAVEWGGNLSHIHQQIRRGRDIGIGLVPSTATGEIDVEALEVMIDDRTGAICLTLAPSNGGLINPAAQVGRAARRAGIPFIVDAAQAVGQIPVDVRDIGCDALTTNSRKFMRGPRGVGILYASRDFTRRTTATFADQFTAPAPDYAVIADAGRYEHWEKSIAAVLGFREAVRLALDLGVEAIQTRVASVADSLRDGLRGVPGVNVHDLGQERSGISP